MKPTPPDRRSPKEAWDGQHRLLISSPLSWQLKAASLVQAFETVVSESERKPTARLDGVAYMLAGYGMENMLKRTLISREAAIDDEGRFKFRSHDLRDLARQAGHAPEAEEDRLLERVQEFTIWTGRYPAPLSSDAMRPRPTPGGFAPRTYHRQGEDWPAIRLLFRKYSEDCLS